MFLIVECAVKNQNANENVFPGWCPCTEPLNCKKNGNIEVPFGEKGEKFCNFCRIY